MSLPLTKKPARKRKAHTADLQQLAARIPAMLAALESELSATAAEMDALNRQGLIYATTFWRKHDGVPKYFYLNHTDAQGDRVKTYIGCDAAQIEQAQAAVDRAKQYDDLQRKFKALESRVYDTHDALQRVARSARLDAGTRQRAGRTAAARSR